MDPQQFLSFPFLFCFSLFIFILFKILNGNKNVRHPPGPRKLPIIGNIHQVAGDTPHRELTKLAKTYGPIMEIKLGQIHLLVLSSSELAQEVLKIQDPIFAEKALTRNAEVTSYNRKDIFFAPYGDEWRQMKKFATLELLSAKRVQSFRHVREEEVAQLMKLFKSSPGSPVNLSSNLLNLTNIIIMRNAIGDDFPKRGDLLELIDAIIKKAIDFNISDVFPSLKWLDFITGGTKKTRKLFKETDKLLQHIVNENRAKRKEAIKMGIKKESENFLDVLLDLQQSENLDVPLTDESIKGTILECFGAGSDSIASSIEWAIAELLKKPNVMKKAQQELRSFFGENGNVDEARLNEIKYLKLVMKETFRLHPPGALIPRMASQKTKVGGYDIAPNTRIFVNAWAIGRDHNIWKDAHEFYPERFIESSIDYRGLNFELLPFGSGKRICPGITYGTITLEFILANLLYHFDWKFPDGVTAENLDMNDIKGGSIKRRVELIMIPISIYH